MEQKWKDIREKESNLWNGKKEEFIDALENNNEEFSWVLDDDKKLLGEKTLQKKSIKYGIPTQVTGNPETAKCFLCLFNPSVDKEFDELDYQSAKLKQYFENIEDNISGADYNNKIKELKSSTIIINERNNIFNFNNGKYYKNYFDGINRSVDITGKALVKEKLEYEDFAKAPICNIELVPYRSRQMDGLNTKKFLKESSTLRLTAKIIVQRIIDYWSGQSEKPIFFMRSVRKYKIAINSFLNKKPMFFDNIRISSFQDLIDNKLGCGDGSYLFYELLSQSGSIINTSVRPLMNSEEINKRDEGYMELIRGLYKA